MTWANHLAKKTFIQCNTRYGMLIFFNIIHSIIASLCYFLSPYFVNNLHLSISQASAIIAFFSLGAIFGGLISGKLSDLFSPKLISILNILAEAAAFWTLPFLHSSLILMINAFILGFSSYGFMTANSIRILSLCGERKLFAINLLEISSNLGLGIAALSINLISIKIFHEVFNYATMFLLLLVIGLLLHQPKNNPRNAQDTSNNVKIIKFSNKKIIFFVFANLFFVGIIISQLGSNYAIYLQKQFPDYNFGGFGFIFALNTFVVVFLQIPISNMSKAYNNIFVIGLGVFLLGLGMAMLIFTHYFSWIIFACIVYTLGEILFFSIAQYTCYQATATHNKGQIQGLYRAIYASSRFIGPAMGGLIYQAFTAKILWTSCGVIGGLCLVSALYFNKLYTPASTSHLSHR